MTHPKDAARSRVAIPGTKKGANKNSQSLSGRQFFRVIRDINAIPSGVYELVEMQESAYLFTIDDSVFFGIINPKPDLLKKVPVHVARSELTSLCDFKERYFALLYQPRKFDPCGAFTWCSMNEPAKTQWDFNQWDFNAPLPPGARLVSVDLNSGAIGNGALDRGAANELEAKIGVGIWKH